MTRDPKPGNEGIDWLARNLSRTIIHRKVKEPQNDPHLNSLLYFRPFSFFLNFFRVPQRIGVGGANLGGAGPRGEVCESGGNGGDGQKVGGALLCSALGLNSIGY